MRILLKTEMLLQNLYKIYKKLYKAKTE